MKPLTMPGFDLYPGVEQEPRALLPLAPLGWMRRHHSFGDFVRYEVAEALNSPKSGHACSLEEYMVQGLKEARDSLIARRQVAGCLNRDGDGPISVHALKAAKPTQLGQVEDFSFSALKCESQCLQRLESYIDHGSMSKSGIEQADRWWATEDDDFSRRDDDFSRRSTMSSERSVAHSHAGKNGSACKTCGQLEEFCAPVGAKTHSVSASADKASANAPSQWDKPMDSSPASVGAEQ